MFIFKLLIPLFILVLPSIFNFNSLDNVPGKARLEIKQEGDKVIIRGEFINNSKENLQFKYRLQTESSGSLDDNYIPQAGWFSVEPTCEILLTQSTININPKEKYFIKLLIYNDLELVAQDSVFIDGRLVKNLKVK